MERLACLYPRGRADSDSEDENLRRLRLRRPRDPRRGPSRTRRGAPTMQKRRNSAWSRARLNKLKRHRAEARKQRSYPPAASAKTRKPSKPPPRYEDAVAVGWCALSLDGY